MDDFWNMLIPIELPLFLKFLIGILIIGVIAIAIAVVLGLFGRIRNFFKNLFK